MRTDSTYDTMTRALTAIVEVRDPYGKGASGGVPLAPGLFVDAEIEGRTFENAIVFPRDGLRPAQEVYTVDNKGKAQVRIAEVLDTNAERAVIAAGVAPGELVVLKKKDDPDALNSEQKKTLLAALSADYAKIMREMSEEENRDYAKLDDKGKAAFLRKKLAAMPEKPWGGKAKTADGGE